VAAFGFAPALLGCARYPPLPLATIPPLAPVVAALPRPPLAAGTPLHVADVVALALDNSPDLRAVRARHTVARAQLLKTGLPPNPVFSGAALPLLSGVGRITA